MGFGRVASVGTGDQELRAHEVVTKSLADHAVEAGETVESPGSSDPAYIAGFKNDVR
jgi:hypothetical protein